MAMIQGLPPTPTALVIVPAGLNYFYELHGQRLAEALRTLGFEVEIRTLASSSNRRYDLCLLTNISEIVISYGQEGVREVQHQITPAQERAALDAVRRLHYHCASVFCCPLECTSTPWYEGIQRYCQATGIATILDFGLHDQSAALGAKARALYHYLTNGLTPSERRMVDEAEDDDERPIPWSIVGHVTQDRIALVERLVQQVDPRGFVYLPHLTKVASKGSPHLNQAQFDAVLRRSRYQIWCSHHKHFYMEGERFRMSLLAGCVPIKVVPNDQPVPSGMPFRSLVLSEAEVVKHLREFDFRVVRRRFRDDFRNLPGLTESLAAFLMARGIVDSQAVTRAGVSSAMRVAA